MQPEFALIVIAAVLPPCLIALLVMHVTRPECRSWVGACTAFTWGAAVATSIASAANDHAVSKVTHWLGADLARSIVPVIVGPIVEELAKTAGLLVVAVVGGRRLATARGGAVAGALLGLGFAAAENITYYTLAAVQAGYPGLVRAIYLRGLLQGFNHATFTAVTGAILGWLTSHGPRRWQSTVVMAMTALLVGIGIHAFWNTVASAMITTILCNAPAVAGNCAPTPDAIDLFVTSPTVVVATIGPVLLLLAWRLRDEA